MSGIECANNTREPLCLFAAHVLHWGIVGVYALLTSEELFRLAVTLVMFKKRSWMVSLTR